jgi:hypothetical protein
MVGPDSRAARAGFGHRTAFVGKHAEFWHDCIDDSIVWFQVERDIEVRTSMTTWHATEGDALFVLVRLLDADEIEIVDA